MNQIAKIDIEFKEGEAIVPYSLGYRCSQNKPVVWNDNSKFKEKLKKIIKNSLPQEISPVPLKNGIGIKVMILTPHNHSCYNKPDLDNMIKTIIDAGTGIVYEDDCQVCYLNAFKTTSVSNRWSLRIRYYNIGAQ